MLQERSPYDSGQLHDSIQMRQLSANQWIVEIGDANGNKTGTPSEEYAHITNDYKTLGKYGKTNRNYHWVNKTIKKWAEQNMLQFSLEGDEDEE